MKIEVFEITSKEDKVYQELLNQYKTNVKLKAMLNVSVFPPSMVLAGDLRLITVLDRIIGINVIKIYLVKDVDNDTFLWVIGKYIDSGEIEAFPLLKKQSKNLQLEIRKILIEKGLFKDYAAKKEKEDEIYDEFIKIMDDVGKYVIMDELDGVWENKKFKLIIRGETYESFYNNSNYGKGKIIFDNENFTLTSTHARWLFFWLRYVEVVKGKYIKSNDALNVSNIEGRYSDYNGKWVRLKK